MIVLVSGVVSSFLFIFFVAYLDAIIWNNFVEIHSCVIIGEVSGSSSFGYGITYNGKFGTVSTYTPGKTGYSCDDGVTYWR